MPSYNGRTRQLSHNYHSSLVQSPTSLALKCNCEFPEKSSLNDLWISFRDQTSLLTSKATPPLKHESAPYINPTTHFELNGQSNDTAKPGLRGKILVKSPVPLLTSNFNKSNGGLGEWKLANSAKLTPKKIFANRNQNPASTSSGWLPCNHRPRIGRPSQTDISRFLS